MEGKRCCLIAGAGSGKTHTMVARILRDIATGCEPETMVVVTFTNAAAGELRERLERAGSDPDRFRHIGTLHSWATRESRRRGEDWKMASDRDIKEMIAALKKTLGAMARNMSNAEIWRHAVQPPAFGNGKAVGMALRGAMRTAGLIHHDLVLQRFLQACLEGRVTPPGKIYVDEYQDSSPTDAAIYDDMALQGSEIYVIGDPRQAIYGFRGATPMNLALAWAEADAREVLTINFRSGWAICHAATECASRMDGFNFEIGITVDREEPGEVERFSFAGEVDEMVAATAWIKSQLEAGGTAAVLCRYNAQATAMAATMRAAGIKTACSADRPAGEALETLQGSIEKLQTLNQTPQGSGHPPRDWWTLTMTALGIPFGNQDHLIGELLNCQTPDDLASLDDKPTQEGNVMVATIHAAKGLEWDAVWFLGADSQAFKPEDQEAGRLAYVAITRARTNLAISHARSRTQSESGKTLTGLTLTGWLAPKEA